MLPFVIHSEGVIVTAGLPIIVCQPPIGFISYHINNFVQEPIYSNIVKFNNYEESGHVKYFCVRFLLEVQKMCISVVLME